jgi:uncharacterized membrane protein
VSRSTDSIGGPGWMSPLHARAAGPRSRSSADVSTEKVVSVIASFSIGADAFAFVYFAVLVVGYQTITGIRSLVDRSIVGAVQRQRVDWMRNMAVRDQRIVDAQLLGGLSQGNAFFASTSALIVGGIAATLGSGEQVQVLLERLPYVAKSSAVLFETKLLLLVAIFVYAFFKFAWAFRLSHYAAIMIGATPIFDATNQAACEDHANRTARLIGIAAEHANGGLRSYYYAGAGMTWFFHPWAFVLGTTWVVLILLRRDFFSRSRRLIMNRGDDQQSAVTHKVVD